MTDALEPATAALLTEAADRWGTPIYVLDLDRALENAAAWRRALPERALVAYAVKANSDPALLRRLATEGFGFEVVGPIELALALRSGVAAGRVVVNGVGQTDADLAAALATGALVNAETLGGLDALLAADVNGHGRIGRIGLRINPAVDARTHPHLATGAAASKFGIALDEVPDALDRVRRAGRRLASVGAHIGSAIVDPASFAALADRLQAVADEAGVDTIDLGGGFDGAPETWAAAVRPRLRGDRRLIVEPGRKVVADAGWLVTRVVRVQDRGHLVADAGMTELIRPMLYGARHPVTLLRTGAATAPRRWTLAGPVCEAGDLLATDLDLGTAAGEGALLAVERVGAYGAAMASTYNGRPRAAEAVIEGGRVRLSRRRETLEDLLARDVEPVSPADPG
jgi:diaminopimelate decarboxylase